MNGSPVNPAPTRVFDFFTSLPTPDRVALEIRSWGRETGYQQTFGSLWERLLGLPASLVSEVASLPRQDYLSRAHELLLGRLPSVADTVERLHAAGIQRAVVHAPLPVDIPYPVAETAQLVAQHPETLIGFARLDLDNAENSIEQVRHGVADLSLRGITVTPFWHGISPSDERFRPVIELAAELDVPLWLHTSMHWVRQRPLEIEHPRHVDTVAGEHPEVNFICGHAGWPWVQELVAVAWRHNNVFVDYSAFRPKHLFTPGAGWEALAYHGSRGLRDKLLYGSTWSLLGREPSELIREAEAAPWPRAAIDAWLYDNAARLMDGQLGGVDTP